LQSLASFFPQFRLIPPSRVVMQVCVDASCHLAGAAKNLEVLRRDAGGQVSVEGVSCLGRCDRAPAACARMVGVREPQVYLGRTAIELKEILHQLGGGHLPLPDTDASYATLPPNAQIDPYEGIISPYLAVRRAVRLRDESLNRAGEILGKAGWG